MAELSTLNQNRAPLPEKWVERIFTIMAGRYGSKFTDAWRGTDPKMVKAIWADDLAGFSDREIKRGLDSCRDRDWPPTLPEFRKLCRPQIDYVSGYYEAVSMLRFRNSTLPAEVCRENWSNAAFFWAAIEFGSDLSAMPYDKIEKRWISEVQKASEKIENGELSRTVPKRQEQLPPPERVSAAHPCASWVGELVKQAKAGASSDGGSENGA